MERRENFYVRQLIMWETKRNIEIEIVLCIQMMEFHQFASRFEIMPVNKSVYWAYLEFLRRCLNAGLRNIVRMGIVVNVKDVI